MQGASATEHLLDEFAGKPVKAFVVWEPVLPTDWAAPSTATLKRIADSRASQYWDKARLISRWMGEHDRRSIVWDRILIYPPGVLWQDGPPEPVYQDGPVVKVAGAARDVLAGALDRLEMTAP